MESPSSLRWTLLGFLLSVNFHLSLYGAIGTRSVAIPFLPGIKHRIFNNLCTPYVTHFFLVFHRMLLGVVDAHVSSLRHRP